jgi:hypothetical protein
MNATTFCGKAINDRYGYIYLNLYIYVLRSFTAINYVFFLTLTFPRNHSLTLLFIKKSIPSRAKNALFLARLMMKNVGIVTIYSIFGG